MTQPAYTEGDAWAEFLAAMASAGIRTRDKIAPTPTLQRFHIEGHKNGSKNGWLVFHSDHPASGAFGDYKAGIQDTWTMLNPSAMDANEREALRRRMEDAKRQRAAELAAAQATCREAAAAIWAAVEPARVDHPYLIRKGLNALPGLKQLARDVKYTVADFERPNRVARKGVLVLPIRSADKVLHSVQTIDGEGRKHFLFGTNKKGHYHSFGKLTKRIVIAEGASTAASIHQATGLCTVIAFDAGNLLPVGRAISRKYPEHEIVFGADNDRFTVKPVANPGMTKACEAAAEIGGLVAWPEFDDGVLLDDGGIPNDFNDLAALRGPEAVAAAFEAAMRPHDIENHADPRHRMQSAPAPSSNVVSLAEARAEREAPPPEPEEDERSRSKSPVKHLCVGFEAGPIFYFKSEQSGLIISATTGELGKTKFLTLADLSFWEFNFPSKQGCDWIAATNAMISECYKYDYEPSAITGRGVHLDNGRVVLHLGNKLIIDGKPNEPRMSLELDHSSRIYERRSPIRLKGGKPLDAATATRLATCLDLLPWTSSDMGRIFAGWIVTAPICGMLTWRPHLWLVGPAGSGKSWVLKHVAAEILGKLAVRFQGAATEAGVRQTLERDALPVIFDEAESQNEKSRERLQLIVDMARQSSSEDSGDIVKGGQGGKPHRFRLQSTFLFGSINLGADQAADLSRIITLSLEGPPQNLTIDQKKERRAQFDFIKKEFAALMLDDFGPRLFARSLLLAKTIRANAEMLAAVIAENAENQRVSDTVALPMAGWFSLTSEALLTREAARDLVRNHSWALDVAERNATESDHEQCIAHLLNQKVRVNPLREESVATLIWKASAGSAGQIERSDDDAAYKALTNIGIRVIPGNTAPGYAAVWFAQSHSELARFFVKTPWEKAWGHCIGQHPKCLRLGPKAFANRRSRALSFNLDDLGIVDD